MSGPIPVDPATGELVAGDIAAQARRAFDNRRAVCEAAGGSLDDVARAGLYPTNLGQCAEANAVMAEYFSQPYPARSTIEASSLHQGASFEVDPVQGAGWPPPLPGRDPLPPRPTPWAPLTPLPQEHDRAPTTP